jgi:hypothetical protein
MKHFIVFLLILISASAFSKIWRVNNNAGIDADFTTAQLAHDGAAATDTIMFEPSATSYGNMTITKQLVIFGVGYYHGNNYPNSPITTGSTLGTVTFNAGSGGSLLAGTIQNGNIDINTSNITIKGVFAPSTSYQINLNSATNIVIARCYYVYADLSGTCSSILVTNNLLQGFSASASHSGVVFKNNVISGNFTCNSQTMTNNILCNGTATISSSALSNNIDARVSPSTAFGSSNGNFGSVLPTAVFQGGSVSGFSFNFSSDGDLQLKVASPAIGVGSGGEDCGMYGGAGPYVLSGLPPIPMLTKLVSTGIGSDVTPVQITISAKSNN